jgi:GNAT superfamily N-acetyltransferase
MQEMTRAITHSCHIRQFNPNDWQTYKLLRLSSLTESSEVFGSTLELEAQRSDADWSERLLRASVSGRDCPLMANIEGRPAGLIWAKFDSEDQFTVNLFQMWVIPEVRGRGVAQALLQAAIDWAKTSGARTVKLGVASGDTPALRLYLRAGFCAVGATELLRPGSSLLSQNMVLQIYSQVSNSIT